MENQIDVYPKIKLAALDPLTILNTPSDQMTLNFRFIWALDLIDNLRHAGSVCYNLLDVGTHDGLLSLLAASKTTDGTATIHVDSIEAHSESFTAASEMAASARKIGLDINVHNIFFEEYKTQTVYDIIIAFEILEHTKDPMFCIEKMYELLEIGGHLLITLPEESGSFGVRDKNPFHYWTSTIQSTIFTLFSDDRKWHVKQVFEQGDLIHVFAQKITKM